jgi:hypothetical protein
MKFKLEEWLQNRGRVFKPGAKPEYKALQELKDELRFLRQRIDKLESREIRRAADID